MKILIVLCICVITINSQKISYKNFPVEVIKSSSPEYFANLILQKLDTKNPVRLNVSNKCITQLLTFGLSLLKLEDWAVNMFDANAKLPSGLLRGHASGLGSFDQCLNIQKETNFTGVIKGKYCLGEIPIVDVTPQPYQRNSRMVNLESYKINLEWAMCLPDGCTADEFQELSIIPLTISTNSCQTADSQTTEYDLEDYCAMVFFGFVLILMFVSTSYEAFNIFIKKKNTWNVFYSFSVITNTLNIITVKKDNDEITCLHGMRVISLLFLMYGFRYGTYMLYPLVNLLDLYEWVTNDLISVYFEGILVVDTFFLMSGLLLSYNYLKLQSKKINFNLLWHYLARIIRLSPALFAIVLLNGTLMRHMGSGPIWPLMKNTLLVNNCRENWWSTLLYVQNYVHPNETCLIQTWHLAVDMQLYLLSPFFFILLNAGRLIFYISCGVFVLGAVVASFVISWKYEIKSLFLANLVPEEFTKYMSLVFYAIQTRIPPWTIGIILGYIVYNCKQKAFGRTIRQYFTPTVILLCWILAVGLVVLCLACPGIVGGGYDWVKNTLHIALIRIAWSLGIAWIIFACINGFSGPVNTILSSPICQIISRISYCTFLTNITVIIFVSLQTRTGTEFSNINVLHKFWSDLVYTLTVGFIWTLAFQSPFIRLQKAFSPLLQKLTKPIIVFQETFIEILKEKGKSKTISTTL